MGRAAALPEWRIWCGDDLERVRRAFLSDALRDALAVACPEGCGCSHRLHPRPGGVFVGVCQCGADADCADIELSAADVRAWELNVPRLGRAVVGAFECAPMEAKLAPGATWQVGVFASKLPILLTIQSDQESLRAVAVELAASLEPHFILLVPTARFLNVNVRAILKGAKAGGFDLESLLTLLPNGQLRSEESMGSVFSRYLPEMEAEVSEQEMRQAYARLLLAFGNEKPGRKAPLKAVFDFYCRKELSAEETRIKCKCSKGTVIQRLDELKQIAHVPADELRTYRHLFEGVDASLRDPRAKRIQRNAQTDGREEEDHHG